MGESKEKVITLAIIFIALPLVAVALRFRAKSIMKGRLRSDDYMILFALVNTKITPVTLLLTTFQVFTVGTGLCQLICMSPQLHSLLYPDVLIDGSRL